jgi:peptidoglycan LD-endopeptidase LytH
VKAGGAFAGVSLGLALGVGVMVAARVRSPAAESRPARAGETGPGGGSAGRAAAEPSSSDVGPDLVRLRNRSLALPLPGLEARQLRDSFGDPRTGHVHEALDIPAPRGTRVVAVEDGTVARIFTSARGGLTVYQYDPDLAYCYYYAHLDRYAPGLKEGAAVRRGDLLGFVGTSGNAPPDTPHLHFAIFRLGSPPRWWEGTPVNPFAVFRPEG